MRRDFLKMLVMTDASTEFGFGVSVASCPYDTVVDLSTKSERRGDYIVLEGRPDGDVRKLRVRQGTPVPVPLTGHSFRAVLSMKARYAGHAGQLEGQSVLLAVQWVLRSAQRSSARLVLGIDAKAVVNALLKGRSSSSLSRLLRSIGAHCLAGNLLLYPLWVPSEWNPADRPSRGKRARPPSRTVRKTYLKSFTEFGIGTRRVPRCC